MKLNKILTLAAGALIVASCSDIDEQYPQGNSLTAEQLQETIEANPERINATFTGMFSMMCKPYAVNGSSQRADDFGYGSMALSQDAEGADLLLMDNNYNWFSTCGEFSSRDASYANPYQRYKHPYTQVGICNQVIASYPEDTQDKAAIYNIAQARAMRAFAYMQLAPYFAFDCVNNPDALCIPILRDGVDYANNPRATNKEVWEYIIEDLNYAVKNLAGFERPNKMQIDQDVAFGLRARANLAMGNWKAAANDADTVLQHNKFTPASIEEVSHPAFCKIEERNWMWGFIMTEKMANDGAYATVSSWISAFSWNGYAAATENVPMINVLLYNKIPETDVRKGWWLNADKQSPLLEGLEWGTTGVKGQAIVDWEDPDGNKVPFPAYANVKFGMKSGIGSTTNNNDWPFMRIEEMYLIKAEGLAKSGDEGGARDILNTFVQTYRDPAYKCEMSSRSLADEIWFQRRVELWGEGFFTADMKRLGKPLVRFHGEEKESNVPDAFKFNMQANDGWLNMRFSKYEYEYNIGIVDNKGGNLPEAGQEPALRDGVTD